MNIVSNLIFHCNYCDANTAFITIHESTAVAPSRPSGLLNAKFTFKGTSPPIIFARIVRPMNAFTTLSLTVFTQVLRLRRYERK